MEDGISGIVALLLQGYVTGKVAAIKDKLVN